jgi:hypothetical protein
MGPVDAGPGRRVPARSRRQYDRIGCRVHRAQPRDDAGRPDQKVTAYHPIIPTTVGKPGADLSEAERGMRRAFTT